MDRSQFWNKIYQDKNHAEQSWFQEVQAKSLDMILGMNLASNAKIIDIGGGDSKLVDSLLGLGYSDISILDISGISLAKAKERLKAHSSSIQFIESDVTIFKPRREYDVWHDRATFHFLNEMADVEKYLQVACEALCADGNLIVSTFSKTGPEKCSGLSISQYSEADLKAVFGKYFKNTRCFEDAHLTPWGTTQNFVYCGFKKSV